MMQFALHTVLVAGREQEYEAVHKTIPAEVAASLSSGGVRDWRIWRDGRHLFHLVDVDDYYALRESLQGNPANAAWKATVRPLHSNTDEEPLALLWSLAEQLGRDA